MYFYFKFFFSCLFTTKAPTSSVSTKESFWVVANSYYINLCSTQCNIDGHNLHLLINNNKNIFLKSNLFQNNSFVCNDIFFRYNKNCLGSLHIKKLSVSYLCYIISTFHYNRFITIDSLCPVIFVRIIAIQKITTKNAFL